MSKYSSKRRKRTQKYILIHSDTFPYILVPFNTQPANDSSPKSKSNPKHKEQNLLPKTTRLLAEGYEKKDEEDLALAKDFAAAENELDANCAK